MQFHLQTTDMIIEMLFWSLENNVLFNYFEMYILLLHTASEMSQWGAWRSVTSTPEALPLQGFLAASMTSDLWDWSTHPRDLWFCLSRAQKYPFLSWGQHIPTTTVDGVNLLLGKGLWAPAASHQVSDIFAHSLNVCDFNDPFDLWVNSATLQTLTFITVSYKAK